MHSMEGASGCGVYPTYGLFYFGIQCPSFHLLNLPEDGTWHIEVIDTWEMTIKSHGTDFKGDCRIELPGKEHIAIRIRKSS